MLYLCYMNQQQHLSTKNSFEIIKYLLYKERHASISAEAKVCSYLFNRSYQTCKRIIKWCEKAGYFKCANYDLGIIRLWALTPITQMPLYKLSQFK